MSFNERIHNINEDECVVDVLLNEVSENECKDCGKCVFGYEGITQLEMILNDLVNKKAQGGDYSLLYDVAEMMRDQSLCETGQDVGEGVLYALGQKQDEINEHINKRACRAEVCKKFLTFHILVSKCDGCGKCLEVCEDEAIMGKPKFVHVVDQKNCIQCGKCIEVCDCGAVVTAGKKKPKTPRKPIPVRVKK